MTLRTRYSELMTLTSQYIKFITDTQRRLEDEEVRDNTLGNPNPNPLTTNEKQMHDHSFARTNAYTLIYVWMIFFHFEVKYGLERWHWHAVL